MLTSHEGGLVMKYRKFSFEFKKQLVEQMLSGEIKSMEICRQHNIPRSLLYKWKDQIEQDSLNKDPKVSKFDQKRIEELERMVGRLTMDNDLLKKALIQARSRQSLNVDSLGKTKVYSEALPGGAVC